MMHDKNRFRDPGSFNPDRFESNNGIDPKIDPRSAVFGFGRR